MSLVSEDVEFPVYVCQYHSRIPRLLTTRQIYVLMRARTSVTANKALMNSERYRIIAARRALAAARVVAYVWLTEYGIDTAYSLHTSTCQMCTSVRHAYLRISWRRGYHRPNEV